MKLDKIETVIRSVQGVNDVHDLHVWSIGSETHALSCHISIEDIPPSVSERILRDVKEDFCAISASTTRQSSSNTWSVRRPTAV